jgi:hypothetical protein
MTIRGRQHRSKYRPLDKNRCADGAVAVEAWGTVTDGILARYPGRRRDHGSRRIDFPAGLQLARQSSTTRSVGARGAMMNSGCQAVEYICSRNFNHGEIRLGHWRFMQDSRAMISGSHGVFLDAGRSIGRVAPSVQKRKADQVTEIRAALLAPQRKVHW